MQLIRTAGYVTPVLKVTVAPTPTNKELAISHNEVTKFAENAATAQQADNRANVMKIIGAAALIAFGFYVLDKRG